MYIEIQVNKYKRFNKTAMGICSILNRCGGDEKTNDHAEPAKVER